MKTNNMYPGRFSFSEIKSMLGNSDEQKNALQIIDKGLGMLRTGNKLFSNLMKTDTPYIIKHSRIGFIKNGEANITINLKDYKLNKNTIAFIGNGSVIQVNDFSDDFEICGMMISNEKMHMVFNGNVPEEYNRNAYNFIVTLENADIDIVDKIFMSAWEIAKQKNYPDETIDGLIYSLVYYYKFLKNKNTEKSNGKKPHNREMFDRFIQLVSTYNKTEHALTFYADKMHVTPRYLGVVIKETSGITAKEWIDRALITNAKIMLKYKRMPIAKIADELNFPNPSFFCKFFRRITDMTPHEFRKRK